MTSKRFLGEFLPILIWLGVIFTLSTRSGGASQTNSLLDTFLSRYFPVFYRHLTWPELDAIHFYIRKAAHVSEYAVLGVLVVRAFPPRRQSRPPWTPLLCWAFCAAYAATDEFHQVFVPGRTPKVTDVLLDAGGAALGIILFALVATRHARAERVTDTIIKQGELS